MRRRDGWWFISRWMVIILTLACFLINLSSFWIIGAICYDSSLITLECRLDFAGVFSIQAWNDLRPFKLHNFVAIVSSFFRIFQRSTFNLSLYHLINELIALLKKTIYPEFYVQFFQAYPLNQFYGVKCYVGCYT